VDDVHRRWVRDRVHLNHRTVVADHADRAEHQQIIAGVSITNEHRLFRRGNLRRLL
jgi:hypothetical protein